jgi:hypothetical protein
MDRDLLAYERAAAGERLQIVINFGRKPASFRAQQGFRKVLLAIGMAAPPASRQITLPACSGLVLEI